MLKKIQKFIKLPTQDKLLFIEAFYTLGMMKRAIDTKPLKDITKDLHHHKGYIKHSISNTKDKDLAIHIGDIIQKASRYTPWQSACLAQSLTLIKMFKKRSIPAMFYLGVYKDTNDMKAHAWSIYGDSILTGKSGHKKFTVVSSIEFIPKEES